MAGLPASPAFANAAANAVAEFNTPAVAAAALFETSFFNGVVNISLFCFLLLISLNDKSKSVFNT